MRHNIIEDILNDHYLFDLFATEEHLNVSWKNKVVFCRPAIQEMETWLKKIMVETLYYYQIFFTTTVVCELPAQTNQMWFHKYVLSCAKTLYVPIGCEEPIVLAEFHNKTELDPADPFIVSMDIESYDK